MLELIPLLIFCFSSCITPGPNNFMIMNSGLNFGYRSSMPHYVGICLGYALMIGVVALGFGQLFLAHDWLAQLCKVLGAGYMFYLAYQITGSRSDGSGAGGHQPLTCLQAMGFQWVNPKAWVMAIGAVSLFSTGTSPLTNSIILSVVSLVVCVISVGIWLWLGIQLKKLLQNEKHRVTFNYLMAFCLALSVILMILD